MGVLGAILFDSGWDVAASRQRSESAYVSDRDELYRRRLAEAHALGAASEQLSSQWPEYSARWGMTTGQRLTGFSLFVGYAAWLFLAPVIAINALAILIAAIFGMIIAMRFAASLAALPRNATSGEAPLRQHNLPMLTILVPLYREAEVVPNLVAALIRLDYPAHRLDIKLLVEADDPGTIAAIERLTLPAHFEVIPIPRSQPRTKPKALNYALAFALGEYVAIFDAEDLPYPSQPRAAMEAFRAGPHNLAVVQAPLKIHNGGDSWIAQQFALEYAIHFGVWLPLLTKLKLPIPLGGTSNYFHRDRLLEVGGWDAWNVTEDADIGIRLARFGYGVGMVKPPTLEEAPVLWRQWKNQRTRWMKGHLQTWLVLNRHPLRAMKQMGALNYFSTHLTLGGGLLASMLHGPLYLWILANLFVFHDFQAWHWIMFALGYLSAIAAALASRNHARPWTLVTMLAYWPLQSWRMLWAMWEMLFKPHFWAKTEHGISKDSASAISPVPVADNVIQLEFPFTPAGDAATRQLAERQ